jgi:acyl carrier protein phosphodiesterase
MANTYKLNIVKLDLSDVVYVVHWKYTATTQDEEFTSTTSGVANIPSPDPENFIPFEDLTQSQVEDWVESAVDLEKFKNTLDNIILEKQTPTTELKDVPW